MRKTYKAAFEKVAFYEVPVQCTPQRNTNALQRRHMGMGRRESGWLWYTERCITQHMSLNIFRQLDGALQNGILQSWSTGPPEKCTICLVATKSGWR